MSEPFALDTLGGPTGFRRSTRFAAALAVPHAVPPEPDAPGDDPIANAYSEGFTAGYALAESRAEDSTRFEAAARETLALSFARLDQELEHELQLRLRDTVAALCEAAIAPLAIDEDALMRRIATAVSMLARADDERVIRLHPDDMALVSPRLSAEWQVKPDPTLERGALRVESSNGGIEDGPAVWRRSIAEALHQC